jgi:hypothetical protein
VQVVHVAVLVYAMSTPPPPPRPLQSSCHFYPSFLLTFTSTGSLTFSTHHLNPHLPPSPAPFPSLSSCCTRCTTPACLSPLCGCSHTWCACVPPDALAIRTQHTQQHFTVGEFHFTRNAPVSPADNHNVPEGPCQLLVAQPLCSRLFFTTRIVFSFLTADAGARLRVILVAV